MFVHARHEFLYLVAHNMLTLSLPDVVLSLKKSLVPLFTFVNSIFVDIVQEKWNSSKHFGLMKSLSLPLNVFLAVL